MNARVQLVPIKNGRGKKCRLKTFSSDDRNIWTAILPEAITAGFHTVGISSRMENLHGGFYNKNIAFCTTVVWR